MLLFLCCRYGFYVRSRSTVRGGGDTVVEGRLGVTVRCLSVGLRAVESLPLYYKGVVQTFLPLFDLPSVVTSRQKVSTDSHCSRIFLWSKITIRLKVRVDCGVRYHLDRKKGSSQRRECKKGVALRRD